MVVRNRRAFPWLYRVHVTQGAQSANIKRHARRTDVNQRQPGCQNAGTKFAEITHSSRQNASLLS
jgi:hypothetical protein